MKINVVHMGFFYQGGGERVVIEQVQGLRKRGHDVRVYACYVDSGKCFVGEVADLRVKSLSPSIYQHIPYGDALGMIWSTMTGKRKELADCDILLCHAFPSIGIGWKVQEAFGTPYVAYLHQIAPLIHPRPRIAGEWKGSVRLLNWIGGRFIGNIRRVDKESLWGASARVFNSKWTRSLFEEHYGVTGDVCYPGIKMKARREHARKFQLATVARHYPWKRLDLACEILKKMTFEPTLQIVGQETSYTRTIKEAAREVRRRVAFRGTVSNAELETIYGESMAYMQTSIEEPFGMVSLEAQSFGCPSVVWGDGGIRETVLNNETGYHVKPYDLDEFASRLDRLLTDRQAWDRMSREAKIWASSFSWESHVDQMEETLTEVVK
jgi:glycosyltransferase involved in cell wall biosynthesis